MKKIEKFKINHRTQKAMKITFFCEEANREVSVWMPKRAVKEVSDAEGGKQSWLEIADDFYKEKLAELGAEYVAETRQPVENKSFVVDIKGVNLADKLQKFLGDYVDSNAAEIAKDILLPMVKEEVKKLKPVLIQIGEREPVKIEGRTHKMFEDCCFFAQHKKQLFIAGPAGSGKTTLGSQVAKAFKLNFYHISCSAGMSEAHILGRMLFDGQYVPSDFVTCYENGGVFLLDEVDAADANTLLTINSALANGIISVPNRKENPTAHRHENFICIASANTWGNGSFEYHGRNHLDAAFLDRFVLSKVEIGYDTELEKEIVGDAKELECFWQIRANCEKNRVRKVVGTRVFADGALFRKAGRPMDKVLENFFLGWSKEEKEKAMNGVFIDGAVSSTKKAKATV